MFILYLANLICYSWRHVGFMQELLKFHNPKLQIRRVLVAIELVNIPSCKGPRRFLDFLSLHRMSSRATPCAQEYCPSLLELYQNGGSVTTCLGSLFHCPATLWRKKRERTIVCPFISPSEVSTTMRSFLSLLQPEQTKWSQLFLIWLQLKALQRCCPPLNFWKAL